MSDDDIEAPFLRSPRPVLETKRRNLLHGDHDGEFIPEHRIDVLRIEKEAVISCANQRFITHLGEVLTEYDLEKSTVDDWVVFCKRIDATVHSWYHEPFQDLLHLYRLFDPMDNGAKINASKLSVADVHDLEDEFLQILLSVFAKSNYKMLSDEEVEVATEGTYLLDLPIKVDSEKLDTKLLTRFFEHYPVDSLPRDADKYLVFRRGVSIDQTTGSFPLKKIDVVLSKLWNALLICLCLRKWRKWTSQGLVTSIGEFGTAGYLELERIHLENIKLTWKNLFSKITLQEPTFEHIILLYRSVNSEKEGEDRRFGDRSIKIKHFRHIPMADMEIVLPEKKTPSLTPSDWVKFGIVAVIGLVAFTGGIQFKLSFSVIAAFLMALLGYVFKVFFAWQESMKQYEEMIKNAMYDKQMDSGRGTLLYLCDDVFQQEMKETALSYFVLITQGPATKEELDRRCETLMKVEFEEDVDFDVSDAVDKLFRLNIIKELENGQLVALPIREANDTIGAVTNEIYGGGDDALGMETRTRSLERFKALGSTGRTSKSS